MIMDHKMLLFLNNTSTDYTGETCQLLTSLQVRVKNFRRAGTLVWSQHDSTLDVQTETV